MTAFTRVGSSLWDWEPFTNLSNDGRVLWLALYTSGEAKRHVPGLWQGGIASMADAARMERDPVVSALDECLVTGMVEYDQKARVLRLCQLPDAGEYPSNGNILRSWWRRFKTVPDCPVRDAHVRTIRWLLDEGAKQAGKSVTPDHLAAWQETFGQIAIPENRRRGVRRLADSDTSTQAQPSLFAPMGEPPAAVMPVSSFLEAIPSTGYPQVVTSPVDNSAALHQINKIRYSETVPGTVSQTVGIQDLGSRNPDLVLLPERGMGGGHDSGNPQLSVVPSYTVGDVLDVLRTGRWDPCFDKTHQDALSARIEQGRLSVGLDDYRALAEHSRVFGRVWDARRLAEADVKASAAQCRIRLNERSAKLAMLGEYGLTAAGDGKP